MAEVIHRYIRRGESLTQPTNERKERTKSDARFAASRAEKEEALATLRQAEVLRKRHELISTNTAVKQASFLFAACRQRMLSLAGSLPRKLVGKTAHEIKLILDAAIRECLTELAELPNRITQEEFEDFVENGGSEPKAGKTSR